jgi:hypothetical protein
MSFLDNLRWSLGNIAVPPVSLQTKMAGLEKQLDALTTKLQGHKAKMPEDAIVNAVGRFQREPRFRNSREALLVSLGCDRPIGNMKYRLIEDEACFPAVLSGVDRFRKHRLIFRTCYRGLLDTYLGYHPAMKDARKAGHENWQMLRDWLRVGTDFVREPDGVDEHWVPALMAHPELFSDRPVEAFAQQVLQGDEREFNEFQQTLGIERTSWLLEQVVLAQIRAATSVGITPHIPKLLTLLEPLGRQNPLIFNQGLVEVLSGYCDDSGGLLHGALRDFSLHFWGNPLFDEKENNTGWITVPGQARTMVKKWFKLHVIQKFFDVLAKQDEENNWEDEENKEKRERRRDFWEQYADVVGDVKFALGSSARVSRDPRMVEVLKLMEGMTLDLYGAGSPQNNAFIMRFGQWVVAEFGLEKNACFVYRASDVPFEYGDTSISAQAIRHHIPQSASSRNGPIRLLHFDKGGRKWEDIFEEALQDRGIPMPTGVKAAAAASTSWEARIQPMEESAAMPSRNASAAQAERNWKQPAPVTSKPAVTAKPIVPPEPAMTSRPTSLAEGAQTTTPDPWRRPANLGMPVSTRSTSITSGSSNAFSSATSASSAGPFVSLPFGAKQEKELLALCRRYDIFVRDMRERQGNLWIALDKSEDNRMTPLLQAYGFKYRPGRGWWYQG